MKMKTTGMMDIKQGFFYAIHFSPFCWLHILLVCFFFPSDFWIIFMICVFFLFHRIKYLMISLHTAMNYSLMYAYMREDCGVIVYWEKKIDVKSYTFYEFKAQMRSLLEQNFALFGFLCWIFCFVKNEFHS